MAVFAAISPSQARFNRHRAGILRSLAMAGSRGNLAALLSGVASPGPALGTDFFGNVQAGLRGAMAAKAQQVAAQAQAEQAQQDLQLRQAQLGVELARAERERNPYGAQPWWLNPGVDPALRQAAQADAFYHPQAHEYGAEPWYLSPGVSPDLRDRFMADALRGPAGPELPFELRATPAQWQDYIARRQAAGIGNNPDQPEQVGSENQVLEYDKMGRPVRTRNRKIFEGDDASSFIDESAAKGDVNALSAMASGVFGDDVKSPKVRDRLRLKARAALGQIQAMGR